MKNFLIKKYIDKITIKDIDNFARSNNLFFSNDDLFFINDLIKNNWEKVLNNDDSVLLKVKDNFDYDKYQKIEKLYYEYKKKYNCYLTK